MKSLYVFDPHAVKRIIQRRLPVEAVVQIATFGVTVQESKKRCMKRGDVYGKPVHVVVAKPNTILTVYVADEWQSTITVQRSRRPALAH